MVVTAQTVGTLGLEAPRERPHRARYFVRHLVEMIVAMMLGMAALVALAMAFDMTVPMVWWMRYRGHDWARGAEMGAAMFVPTFLLIGLLQLGAVSGGSLIGLEHALMLPAMLAVMFWRVDEYTKPHARHGRALEPG
jgi:hypothetical protein